MITINPAVRKFLSYARPYRRLIALGTLCGLLKYNIPVLFPWVLKDVIDNLLSSSPPDTSRIHMRLGFLLVLYVFWALITYLRTYFADRAGQMMIFDLRADLYAHLQRMSLGFFEKRKVGSIGSRLLTDIALAQNFVSSVFTNSVMDLSALAVITVLLFWMNWQLALVSVALLPLYVLLNKIFKKRIRATSKLAQQKMEEIAGDVQEKLGGISIIQSFTREKAEEAHFARENRTYLFHRFTNVRNHAVALSIIGFITSVAPILVVWYGAMQVVGAHLTVGELAAFYAYLGMFYQPLNRLSDLNLLLANSQSAIERIYEFFDTAPDVVDLPGARDVAIRRGTIEFSGVSFGYDPSRRVLENIDLLIPAGSIVALVGKSGAGKSTFIKLIPRFYDVTEGTITIDGVPVRDFRLKSLRSQISLVPQDPMLFSGSIFENILMGRQDATEGEVFLAAEAANALEFIERLPGRYDADIGEGGVRLSGGQKQRIALARAFLKDAPILILDEATSSLDAESEALIQEALARLMQGRTTLIIAHRFSTVQLATKIVVFSDGAIAETGNHEELLGRSDSLYRRLYNQIPTQVPL
jgi:subfamily B ATP-binding cassette protein MsbA